MFNSSCPLNYAEIVSVHMLGRILLPSVPEKSLGFCRLPSLQDFRFTFLCWGGAYRREYRTSTAWAFFSDVSSHTVPLFSCPCIIWCVVPLQVFVQIRSALHLKLKNTWLTTAYASTGQCQQDKGSVQLANVWGREIPAIFWQCYWLTCVGYLA